MTSRPAGRHRKGATPQTPQIPQTLPSPRRPQGLLLLGYPGGDRAPGYYLNSGIVPNSRPLFAPSGGRQALHAAVARDRRTFTMAMSATAAGLTAAVLFGTFAPLHSTWMPSGGSGAAGGGPLPQAPAPWSAVPLGIQPGRPSCSARHRARHWARHQARRRISRGGPVNGPSRRTSPATRTRPAMRTCPGTRARPAPAGKLAPTAKPRAGTALA